MIAFLVEIQPQPSEKLSKVSIRLTSCLVKSADFELLEVGNFRVQGLDIIFQADYFELLVLGVDIIVPDSFVEICSHLLDLHF